MASRPLIDAEAAAGRLGIRKATLYAYVSRGKLRAVDGPGHSRLYDASDVERLRARSAARSGHGPVAGHALRWGEPVLETEIGAIESDGPHYRGRPAIELAGSGASFDGVAELLITGRAGDTPWSAPDLGVAPRRFRALLGEVRRPVAVLSLLIPALALRDPMRALATEHAELERARALISRMAAAVGFASQRARPEDAVHERGVARILALALTGGVGKGVVQALDRALVLILDHELNVSTFAARVAASSGADLYACVAAGLGALAGPLHGGAADRVVEWVRRVKRPDEVRRAVAEHTLRGEAIPGFGHPLYPDGDPRAPPLLAAAHELCRAAPELAVLRALVTAMERQRRERPNVDLGLAALGFGLRAPDVAPAAIFAVGRCAGWIAHVLEQRRAGFLLRPRAAAREP